MNWSLIVGIAIGILFSGLALIIVWRIYQFYKSHDQQRFTKQIQEIGETVRKSPNISSVEIVTAEGKAIITPTKSQLVSQDETKAVEHTPELDLIIPQDVTKITIETPNKSYDLKPAHIKANVTGVFCKSKIWDPLIKMKRYPEAGDRIEFDELIGVVKKGLRSMKILQRVAPDRTVRFLRFLTQEGQEVKPGDEIALVAIEETKNPTS